MFEDTTALMVDTADLAPLANLWVTPHRTQWWQDTEMWIYVCRVVGNRTQQRQIFQKHWNLWSANLFVILKMIYNSVYAGVSGAPAGRLLHKNIPVNPATFVYLGMRDSILHSLMWEKHKHIVEYFISAIASHSSGDWMDWANLQGGKREPDLVLGHLRVRFEELMEWNLQQSLADKTLADLDLIDRNARNGLTTGYPKGDRAADAAGAPTPSLTLTELEQLGPRDSRKAPSVRQWKLLLSPLLSAARAKAKQSDQAALTRLRERFTQLEITPEQFERYVTGEFSAMNLIQACHEIIGQHLDLSPDTLPRYGRSMPRHKTSPKIELRTSKPSNG